MEKILDKVIFGLKNDEQKFEDAKQHIDWLFKDYEAMRKEVMAFREGTCHDEIIQKKEARIEALEKELREFGFSEEEMAEAGKWTEQHYKETKHRGGAAGGNFSYIIIPTGLGIIKEVKCSCGARINSNLYNNR